MSISQQISSYTWNLCTVLVAYKCRNYILFSFFLGGGGGEHNYARLEPNLPLFLPILLSGNARKFYLFCPKLCQHLPILPEIMPVYLPILKMYLI